MAFEIPINMNSVMMVRDELYKSLDNAVQYADAFLAETNETANLAKAIAEINQVNGILRVIEFSGATELSAALLRLGQHIADGKLAPTARCSEVLGRGLHGLTRYVQYCVKHRCALPLAVNPLVNELRALVRQPPLLEAEQAGFRLSRQPDLKVPEPRRLGEDELITTRRLLHMYQVGLLGVLSGQNAPQHFRLMERALERLRRDFSSMAGEEWWLLVLVTIRLFAAGELRLTPARKRQLALIDSSLRRRLRPDVGEAIELSEAQRCELVHLIQLANPSSRLVAALPAHYGVEASGGERRLRVIEDMLAGREGDLLSGNAQRIRDALYEVKETLEGSRQHMSAEQGARVGQRLQEVAGILGDAGFSRLKGVLTDHAQCLSRVAGSSDAVEAAMLEALAEALLLVESTLSDPERFAGLEWGGEGQGAAWLARSLLDEAIGVLLNESKAAIAIAKRGISAYIESGYDLNHVANVGTSLSLVRGALQILGHQRAACVLRCCMSYIEFCRSLAGGEQRRQSVETLADALISMEYYLDALTLSDEPNDSLLAIAEESVSELEAAA